MFLATWLASKLGLGELGAKFMEVLLVLLFIGGLVGYHYYVVGGIEKELTTAIQDQQQLRENNQTLKTNVTNLMQNNVDNQKYIAFIANNSNFLQDLEQKYNVIEKDYQKKKDTYTQKVSDNKDKLGDKPITPLLAKSLNDMVESDKADNVTKGEPANAQ